MYLGGLVRQRLLDGFTYQSFCLLFGLVLFGYACVRTVNIYELTKLIILAEAFIVGMYLSTLRFVFIGLALGLSVSSIFVLAGVSGGLFINVNTLAETSVIVLVGIIIYRIWWLIPGLLPAIFNMHQSRGAILTLIILAAIPFCWLWFIILPVEIWLLWLRPSTIYERLNIWVDVLRHITWFGYGVGSFQPYSYYNIYTRPTNAHNDLLQILFELGIVGIVLAVGFVWLVLKVVDDQLSNAQQSWWRQEQLSEKYILWSFLIIGCFDFPLYLPVSASIAALVCGFIVSSRNDVFLQTS